MSKLQEKIAKIQPIIKAEAKNNKTVITLSGPVGESMWESDAITLKNVEKLTKEINGNIHILLNSGGGDVFQGIAIFNYLKGLKNDITIEIIGLAASAASLIAMAGDRVVMGAGAQMMIHEASTIVWGNKKDLKKTIEALETVDASLEDIYASRESVTKDQARKWINDETWFTAQEAKASGLVDEIVVDQESKDEETEDVLNKILNDIQSLKLDVKAMQKQPVVVEEKNKKLALFKER